MIPKTCPTCGQPLPQARGHRVCADCRRPIKQHDKWYIGNDGKLHHRDCSDPSGYNSQRITTMDLLED
jgi:predicted amidophosphoribosyltransferase